MKQHTQRPFTRRFPCATVMVGVVIVASVVAVAWNLAWAAAEQAGAVPVVRTLGSGSQTFYLVDRGPAVSIYVNGVPADAILEQLRSIGGPTYKTRVELTRPITMALHRVSWRAMFDRMFSGLNVAYHFRGGRIDRIRVLSLVPGRNYKVAPHPPESRETWMQIESVGPSTATPESGDSGVRGSDGGVRGSDGGGRRNDGRARGREGSGGNDALR